MKLTRIKILETSLVLTTGFLVVYFISSNVVFLYLSFVVGFIGIFIAPLAKIIAIAWFKLADILNYIFSKLVLGTLFFVVLYPLSIASRIANKDKLRIKSSGSSNWITRNKKYVASDLENIW